MTIAENTGLSRRHFFIASTAALVGAAIPTVSQAQKGFTFQPDFKTTIARKTVGVDLALLGPNGERTTGFFASLDPFHGQPFSENWMRYYKWQLANGIHDTNSDRVNHVINHVSAHGVPREDLETTYEAALKAWNARSDLRFTSLDR